MYRLQEEGREGGEERTRREEKPLEREIRRREEYRMKRWEEGGEGPLLCEMNGGHGY